VELWQARYVLAVAETGSFRRAAERLNISQPPLSRAVAGLEATLGVTLFERGARGVTLTAAGEAFRREAEVLLRQAERVVAAARGAAPLPAHLLIGFEGPTAQALLPAAIAEWRRHRPEVEVTLAEMATTTQVRALKDSALDIGFVVPPVEDPMVTVAEVWREPMMAVLPPGHALAGAGPIPLSALAEERFVTGGRSEGCGLFATMAALCRVAGFAPRIAIDAADTLLLLDLVAAGAGVSLLPRSVVAKAHGRVAAVPLPPEAVVVLALAHRRDAKPGLVALEFVAATLDVSARLRAMDGSGIPP
jgi:DNA-binding transcriptional LysR family regulator